MTISNCYVRCFTEHLDFRSIDDSESLPRVEVVARIVLTDRKPIDAIDKKKFRALIERACEECVAQEKGGAK